MRPRAAVGAAVGLFATFAGIGAGASPVLPDPATATTSSTAAPGSYVPAVIPAPARTELRDGALHLRSRAPLIVSGGEDAARVASQFAGMLAHGAGIALAVSSRNDRDATSPGLSGAAGSGAGQLRLVLDPARGSARPAGYVLTIGADGVLLTAGDPDGLWYGAVTLWQLIVGAPRDRAARLRAMRIEDAPRFAWRGLMLDSARHYQSPEFIERFIDWMALHKLNVLHWHLVDDQAWRLEIRKYPRLTDIGAWRVPAGAAAAADVDPLTGRPRVQGGYYAQETVRRLVQYARDRHVTIVPEIEMPGHATAAIAAYPSLGVAPNVVARVPADWGIYPNLFNVEESTFAFLEDVLAEVLEMFPGEFIHVGGDEAVKDQWRASARVQQRMRELGVGDEHELQSYFIQRIGRFLAANGRRLIGWDEILEGGLAPDATVMSWRGVDGALAAADAGHDAVLAPWPTLYFDNRQGGGADEPPGRGRIVRLEDVYRFDPMPAGLDAVRRHHILGVQANLWTEHVRTEDRAAWMTWPRAAAVAEIGWSDPARIDWPDFRRRVAAAMRWYDAIGLRYADSDLRPSPAVPAAANRRLASQQLATCDDKLTLSLEDDAPLHGDRAVFLIDIMNPCWIYPGADLTHGATLTADVGQVPFNFQLGKDVASIVLREPASRDGELEVRIDRCDGERVAVLPLAPAAGNPTITRLPGAAIAARPGRHDLCLSFTARTLDPMWAIDSVEVAGAAR